MLENALLGLVNAISYWAEFHQHWCILLQGLTYQFWGSKGQRSGSQHDQVSSGLRHTELDAVHRVLISSFLGCFRFFLSVCLA